MQRPHSLDLTPRNSPELGPLPTPPESSLKSPFDRSDSMSPIATRYTLGFTSRRPSRASFNGPNVSDDTKFFVREPDASPEKYMHYFDQLTNRPDVIGPNKSEHQVKQDPTGTLKTWEYQLPEHLWPPLKENAKTQDAALKVRWGRDNGYVQITNIGKALLKPNLKMSEFLKGYDDQVVRIRGGQIEVQGSWIPYDLARKICLEKCYSIRQYLTPLFGPDFVNECVYVESDEQEQTKRRPGRKPRSPTFAVKRTSEELVEIDDMHPPRESGRSPNKRRVLNPSVSGSVNPPTLPSDLKFDRNLTANEICEMLSAARELMRMQRCPYEGLPHNDWPMPGDSRMGGYLNWNDRRYRWNGDDQLIEKSPPKPLPSIKDMVHSIPTQYTRFPITPSPHQSPRPATSYDWQHVHATNNGQALISPPMSCHGSFSGHGRDRQHSVITTDECHTPVQDMYTGSLFPTPQPEGRHEARYDEY